MTKRSSERRGWRVLRLLPASGALLLAVHAPAAWAQVDEIVVQARGQDESVRDIPVAITAVGEEQMENFSLTSLQDVAANTPQLAIVRGSSGSGASISIRGVGSTYTSIGVEQSVAVILDGVYYPQGRVIDEGMFDVSQVAILKGPQALYFGKNATAGAIAITTNDPGPYFESMARVGYEFEQERLIGETMVSVPVTDKFGVRLALRGTKMWGGYIKNNAGPTTYTTTDRATGISTVHNNPAPADADYPGVESLYGRLTLKGTPSDRFTYTLKGSFADVFNNSPTGHFERWRCPTLNGVPHLNVGGTPVPNPQAECNADWQHDNNPIPPDLAATNPLLNRFDGELGDKYKSYGITGKFDLALDYVDITAILNYHKQKNQWVGDHDGGGSTTTMAAERNSFENISAEVRAVTALDGPFNFTVGVYYQNTTRHFLQDVIFAGAEDSSVAPEYRYTAYRKLSDTDGETASVYSEVAWDITDEWQLTGGARYLHETKRSFFEQPYVNGNLTGIFEANDRINSDLAFNDVSPEVTLRWQPNASLTLYAAYKQGFKSGGFSNSGIYSVASPDPLEDFEFQPEGVEGFEGGVKAWLFDDTLTVDLEAYYYKFKNLQLDFFNSPIFAYQTENAGSAKTTGAELQATWQPKEGDGLTISGSLAYNVSKYIDFLAPCYAGQTPAQGCSIYAGYAVPSKQQLAGQPRSNAPKWSGSLRVDYERPIGEGFILGLSTNVQFKSKYYLSAFGNPYDVQNAYATLDAAIRFGTDDGVWQLAVIGKNLTNKYAMLISSEVPSTGGNTGTAAGFVADRYGVSTLPRTVEVQLTWRY
jgi:outer membrane receptor protein involved in Fe transport